MKTTFSVIRALFILIVALNHFGNGTVVARVLDNFNAASRTGWSDFTFQGMGSISQQNGQLHIDVPAVGQSLFAATTKTTESFELKDGRTLEFSVDLISGNDPDSYAGLSWIPTGQQISALAGYSIVKSSSDVIIAKGVNKYFIDYTGAVTNENITLVLSLTAKGANVIVNGKVLDKGNNNAVIFDKTYIDTPSADALDSGSDSPAAPFTGAGSAMLLGYANNQSGKVDAGFSYSVVLDNLQVYVLDNAVLDTFQGATRTGWTDFTFGAGLGIFTQGGGQLTIEIPKVGQALFAATVKNSPVLTVKDGERIELRVDMISGNDKDSFGGVSWLPAGKQIAELAGYSLVKSSTDVIIAKGVNKYFIDYTGEVKNDNITLVLSLTGDGSNVIITGKILDKDNNNGVIFERTYVDTPSADVMGSGSDSPAAPYTGDGNYMLIGYADTPSGQVDPSFNYTVVLASPMAATPPVQGNTPPVISDTLPALFANFLPVTSKVSFSVTDDKPLLNEKISVELNGVAFTQTNGLVITGSGNSRAVSFAGLAVNVSYTGQIVVADADGATNSVALNFDTFSSSVLTVEAEDYNFNGGQFVNNPILIPEGSGAMDGAYPGQVGLVDVDYHDSLASSKNALYRQYDAVGTKRTLDFLRKKFSDAGGTDAGIYDYDIGEIEAGDWLNYTRDFTTGFYEVYLRQSLFNGDQSQAILELVTGDTAAPDQATRVLGSFLGVNSGTKFRNVPLTDGLGKNKVVVQLSGRQTLRLREVTSDPADGSIFQNYLVFIPTTSTGPQRAAISSVSPAADSVVESVSPAIEVVIQNRDTAVKPDSIAVQFNGKAVTAGIANQANGVRVTYSIAPLPASNSTNTVSVTFTDDQNVTQTFQWSFVLSYKSLDTASRRDGPGVNPGFYYRVIQAPSGSGLDNSLERAESQLAAHSSIPVFLDTNFVASTVNFTIKTPPDFDGYFEGDEQFPGLQTDVNGADDFTVEIKAWLQLSAGVHRFGIRCDDGYRLVSGVDYLNPSGPALAFHNGGPADETVDFVAPQAGFYPFRLVFYQRGGGAHLEWYSVVTSSSTKVLIDDLNSTDAVKAFVSVAEPAIQLFASDNAAGPYTLESGATLDTASKTITTQKNGQSRFYRLKASNSLTLDSVAIQGQNVVLKYK